MKYALDVNVALKWVLNEVDSTKARRIRDDWRAQVHELIVPDVFPFEAAHALTRAARRRLIADAAQFWGEIMADCPQLLKDKEPAARRPVIRRPLTPAKRTTENWQPTITRAIEKALWEETVWQGILHGGKCAP